MAHKELKNLHLISWIEIEVSYKGTIFLEAFMETPEYKEGHKFYEGHKIYLPHLPSLFKKFCEENADNLIKEWKKAFKKSGQKELSEKEIRKKRDEEYKKWVFSNDSLERIGMVTYDLIQDIAAEGRR